MVVAVEHRSERRQLLDLDCRLTASVDVAVGARVHVLTDDQLLVTTEVAIRRRSVRPTTILALVSRHEL
jgi:hypothetical protein